MCLRCVASWMAGAKGVDCYRDIYIFCLIILAFSLSRLWRHTIFSVSCLPSLPKSHIFIGQLKSGRARWCDPGNHSGTHQRRDHLFKHCKYVGSRSGAWATCCRMTGAARRVLDFLRSSHVRRTAPLVEENWMARKKRWRRRLAMGRIKRSSGGLLVSVPLHL